MDSFGFKTQGVNYKKFRPIYPKSFLMEPLSKLKHRNRYLDIATGTGKILFQLATHFQLAFGVDVSDQMIKTANLQIHKHPNVKIYKASAENFDIKQKYDYITVGQAFHFFNKQLALKRIKESLTHHGMLTVYGYVLQQICKNIFYQEQKNDNELFKRFYNLVKPQFQFDRDDLHSYYSDKNKYPFEQYFSQVQKSIINVGVQMTKEQFVGYLKTFSGYNYYLQKKKQAKDPIIDFEAKISSLVKMNFTFFRFCCQNKQ